MDLYYDPVKRDEASVGDVQAFIQEQYELRFMPLWIENERLVLSRIQKYICKRYQENKINFYRGKLLNPIKLNIEGKNYVR